MTQQPPLHTKNGGKKVLQNISTYQFSRRHMTKDSNHNDPCCEDVTYRNARSFEALPTRPLRTSQLKQLICIRKLPAPNIGRDISRFNPFVTSGTYISHLQRVFFKSPGVTVSHFFSMLPSTLKYLYSVEPVRTHFPAKQPYTNDTVCNAACSIAHSIICKLGNAF